MLTRWFDAVRLSRKLTIFADSSAAGWIFGLRWARVEFNMLAIQNNLDVRLEFSTTPPDFNPPRGDFINSGANVLFSAAAPAHVFVGRTSFVANSISNLLVKARIIIPTPLVSPPSGPARIAGDFVMAVLAFHELIHACGLDNLEHTPPSNPDVFISQFTNIDGAPNPDDDTIRGAGTKFPQGGVPWLTPRTVNLIRTNWS
jgi:hypothetical protein